MSQRCIECGDNEEFFHHLCKSCYLEAHPILKSKQDSFLVVCLSCGLLSINKQWSKFYLNDLEVENINAKLESLIFHDWEFYYRPKGLEIKSKNLIFNEEEELKAVQGTIDISASPW